MEASPADHLRVVVSFRQRGVPSSDVHALLPKLLRDVRAIGFQVPLIDVPTFDVPAIDREVSATDQRLLQPATGGTAATITLSCEHFLLMGREFVEQTVYPSPLLDTMLNICLHQER